MPKPTRRHSAVKTRTAPRFHHSDHEPDFVLFAIVIGLSLFGLLMIYNVSAYQGFRDFGDKFYFVKQQAIWLGLSIIAGFFGYKISYHRYLKAAPILFGGVLLLLVGVLIPGIGTVVLGARRWITIAGIGVQPSELIKPAVILYFAAWLSDRAVHFSRDKLIQFGVIVLVVLGLIMLEPDMGTSIVILSAVAGIYFAAGAPVQQFLTMIPVGLAGFALLIIKAPYRLKRLTTFLHPQVDPQGASYHISQILLTLGSGGWFGVGLGNSAQKYGYLPEASTDSIFAVIGGEFGYIGAIALICIYLWMLQRIFMIARNAPDKASYLLALGIGLWFAMQTAINMGSMVALFPLTGIPLPFVSYGGSSLVTTSFAVGLLLNISRFAAAGKRSERA